MLEQQTGNWIGHELTPQEFALAIAIFVSQRRTRMHRRRRLQTSYLDDVFAVLDSPAVNPKVRRLVDGNVRLEDLKRRRLCEETRAIYELMEPVIEELSRAIEDA